MDFPKLAESVLSLSLYISSRNAGVSASTLTYFENHEELEQQYLDKINPEQLGRDIIDAAACKALGGLQ